MPLIAPVHQANNGIASNQGVEIRLEVTNSFPGRDTWVDRQYDAAKAASDVGSWSNLYVFRADLELLGRDLVGYSAASRTETGSTEPVTRAAERPASETAETDYDIEPDPPRDTVAMRTRAKKWLSSFVTDGKHRDRDGTLEAMREAHPGLGVRGSRTVWTEFARENPTFRLSRPGAKLKRNANN